MRSRVLVFLAMLGVFCLTSSFKTGVQIPDEEYVIQVASSLAEGRALHLPSGFPYESPGHSLKGREGKRYSSYPIGQSLVLAPFYRIFKSFWGAGSKAAQTMQVERRVTRSLYLVPALISALTATLIFSFGLLLGASSRVALGVTLLSSFGTILWPYSKYILSESTQTLLLLATTYFLCRQKIRREFSPFSMTMVGISFGLLCAVKPTFLILAPLFVVYLFYGENDRKTVLRLSLWGVAFFFIFFAPQLVYNAVRFSGAANFGYSHSSFSSPWWVGLYGLLLSTGKSFFLYSPLTVLFFFSLRAFAKQHRQELLLFSAIIVVMILVYARWDIWSGDYSWGPRFLVPLVPLFMIPTISFFEGLPESKKRWKTIAVVVLVAVSFGVQLLAVSVHYLTYLNYFKHHVSLVAPANKTTLHQGVVGKLGLRDHNFDYQFVPEFSPLLGQWWVVKNLLFQDPKAFASTPWRGLGLNKFHGDKKLEARWDFWFAE